MQYVVVPITLIKKGFLIRYACENWEEVENVNCNYCHSLELLTLLYLREKRIDYEMSTRVKNVQMGLKMAPMKQTPCEINLSKPSKIRSVGTPEPHFVHPM